MVDTVAKVLLHHRLQILRAVRSAIEQHLRAALYCDELKGDFGSGPEAISLCDFASFTLFAEIGRTAFWGFAALSSDLRTYRCTGANLGDVSLVDIVLSFLDERVR